MSLKDLSEQRQYIFSIPVAINFHLRCGIIIWALSKVYRSVLDILLIMEECMNDLLALGKISLSQQPFSCFMQTEFEYAEKGDVVLCLKIKDEFKQNFGAVHGGVISYMADIGLAYAAASEIGDCVTSELKINYLRPAAGTKIIVRAKSLSVTNRQVVAEARIFNVDEQKENPQEILVAIALGTIIRIVDKRS